MVIFRQLTPPPPQQNRHSGPVAQFNLHQISNVFVCCLLISKSGGNPSDNPFCTSSKSPNACNIAIFFVRQGPWPPCPPRRPLSPLRRTKADRRGSNRTGGSLKEKKVQLFNQPAGSIAASSPKIQTEPHWSASQPPGRTLRTPARSSWLPWKPTSPQRFCLCFEM